MATKPVASIILPYRNSGSTLTRCMESIMNQDLGQWELLAVNDHSDVHSIKILEEFSRADQRINLINSCGRGISACLNSGIMNARSDIIIRMDCDDTHEPKYIPDILKKLDQGYDVVVASRFEKGGGQMGVDGYRAFISRGANLFMKIFFPISGLKEYSCGYRGYRYSKIKEAINFFGNNFIQLKGLGFTCTLEKLVKLKLIGAKFGEIPFLHRYDQKQSDSKMVSSVTTLGYLVMTILYHWPWGGWRSAIAKKHLSWKKSNDSIT